MRGRIDDEIAARFDVMRDGTVRVSLDNQSFLIGFEDLAILLEKPDEADDQAVT